ncbi:hypothetical protein C8F01DRAFT_55052 [Mycena amicta]|nr:hypothetical protein C8F01DRAFT_55052 [Mycena amicta]
MDIETDGPARPERQRRLKSRAELKKAPTSKAPRKEKSVPSDHPQFEDDDDVNKRRRAKRRAEYNPDAELLAIAEAGRRQASRVGTVLIAETLRRVGAEQQRRLAVARPDLFGLPYLQNVVKASCDAHGETQIDPKSPAWQCLPLKLSTAIANSSRTLTFDPTPFVQSGDLQLCDGSGDVDINSYDFYLRVVEVAGREQAVETLYNIISEHPREAPHVVVQLLVCQETPDEIRERAKPLFVPFGLEEVVDLMCDTLAEKPLYFADASADPNCFLYAGITRAVLPSQRATNDITAQTHCRMTKLRLANPSLVVKTYRITALTTNILSKFAVRVDPLISELERIIIALAGEASLNSASGGEQPIYQPTPELLSLRDHVLEVAPHQAYPLGQDENRRLCDELEKLCDDELQCFKGLSPDQTPADKCVQYVKQVGLGSVRQNRQRVVAFTVTKDISLEAYNGTIDGYFAEVTGAGPREHRYFLSLIHPSIPRSGDLSQIVIARWIGGFLDFWRFMHHHHYWWLHVLFLARFLDVLRPLILVTQSNPVAKTIRSGYLAQRRQEMIAVNHFDDFFNKGLTTEDFVDTLRRQKPPKFVEDEYLAMIGHISLLPIGTGARLTMHVAGGDYGLLKYQPQHYQAWAKILFLVAIVVEVLKRVTADRQEQFPMTPTEWEDELATRRWLQDTIDDARSILQPVYMHLDLAKDICRELTFVDSFLSTLAASRRSHLFWQQEASEKPDTGPRPRPPGILAADDGEARKLQGQAFVDHAERLTMYDLWHDPHHVEPYGRPIGSAGWWTWFMALNSGVELIYSTNSEGKTADAAENALRTRRDIALYRHLQAKEAEEPKRHRHLENAVDKAADMKIYDFKSWENSARFGVCRTCNKILAADTNYITHKCVNGDVKLDLKSCPTLERFLYPHDGEDFFAILGFKSSVLQKLELKTFTVGDILTMDGQLTALTEALPHDWEAVLRTSRRYDDYTVYARPPLDSPRRLLMMAVDVVLRSQSREAVPVLAAHFEPLGSLRTAGTKANRPKFDGWLKNRHPQLYFGSCRGPGHDADQWTLVVTNTTTGAPNAARPGKLKAVGSKCAHCQSAACEPCEIIEATSIFGMPYHFARMAWFNRALDLGWLKSEP